MIKIITLLIYSILPVSLIGVYIYNKDKNKEPTNLIIKLLLGGVSSAIITIITSAILGIFLNIFNTEYTELSGLKLIIYSFACIALIEEISKWIMLYIIAYNTKEYDESYDMLLYGAFTGLGFACIENIFYVLLYGLSTAVTRAFTAVPMHTILGIMMGYYLDKFKTTKITKNKILSITIPTLIHGAYDYYLLQGDYSLISIIILIVSFIYTINLIQKINNESISKKETTINFKEKYCPNCGQKYELKFCRTCGRKRN